MTRQVLVGVSGWSYPDWEGTVYPKRSTRGFDALAFMAEHFDAVEINSSFYRTPAPRAAADWAARVASKPEFRFSAKLHQRFTHQRDEAWTSEDAEQFRQAMAPLVDAGRLGAVLVQFPWSFRYGPTEADWLARLAHTFTELPLVVEVRHTSWLGDEAQQSLNGLGVGFCNIDQPPHRDGIPPTEQVMGGVGYVRLHGRNAENWFAKNATPSDRYDYLYREDELDEWIERIHRIADQADHTYVFTNNHYRGQAPANALQIMAKLRGEKVTVPDLLQRTYPALGGIASNVPPPAQAQLF